MLANLLIKLLEQAGNIAEGLFWLGLLIILFFVIAMLVVSAVVIAFAVFA